MEFTHTANPVRVHAAIILGVIAATEAAGAILQLSDGRTFTTTEQMTARYAPVEGDYLVTQEDGYEYINPKDVFERKYSVGQASSLIVITIRDTPDGGVAVSMVGQPEPDMTLPLATEAQRFAFAMLETLPKNPPANDGAEADTRATGMHPAIAAPYGTDDGAAAPCDRPVGDGLAEPDADPDLVPHSTASAVQ